MRTPPPPRGSHLVVIWVSIGLQVVTALVFMGVLFQAGRQREDLLAWLPLAGVAIIPLLAQGLICSIKNEPIIHFASLVTSVAILAWIVYDLVVPSYVPLGTLAPWPIVLLVMTCGNVIAWIVETRRRRSR